MFEADNQVMLSEYVDGFITAQNFEDQMRLWKNNATDYQPLVELAKDNQRPFIATNVPRRYASIVFRNGIQGLDSLSDEAKKWLAQNGYDPKMGARPLSRKIDELIRTENIDLAIGVFPQFNGGGVAVDGWVGWIFKLLQH